MLHLKTTIGAVPAAPRSADQPSSGHACSALIAKVRRHLPARQSGGLGAPASVARVVALAIYIGAGVGGSLLVWLRLQAVLGDPLVSIVLTLVFAASLAPTVHSKEPRS